MSNYTTTQDILLDVLWRAFENTDGSSQYKDAALRYINRAYRSLWMGGTEFMPNQPTEWWWMRDQASLILNAYYHTGTVTVTNASNIVTLSAAPTISLQGYHFLVTGDDAVYQITSHIAGDVGILLDSNYAGTSASGSSYQAMPLDYDLPSNCLKIIDPMITHRESGGEVFGVGLSEMWQQYPLIQVSLGTPKLYAPLNETQIRFSHYLDEQARLDYFFLVVPDDLTDSSTSVPLMPLNYRHVLADMAAFFVLTDKEEQRAVGIGAQAKAGIQAMATENAMRWGGTGRPGQIDPRQGENRSAWRRTASGYRLWWGR